MSGEYKTDQRAFDKLVELQRAEYEKLSDAKLLAKIKHLRGAEARMTLPRNAELMAAFRAAAADVIASRARPVRERVP